MPFIEPTTTRTCFHTFCRDCIIRAIAHVPQCPIDRSPLELDDLTPANPIVRAVSIPPIVPICHHPLIMFDWVRQLVDELVVECPRRPSGCTITCQRQLLATHLKDACPYTRPSSSSSQNHSDQDTQSHQDTVETNSRITLSHPTNNDLTKVAESCSSCSLPASSTEHVTTCPGAILSCPHAINGCQWTGSRQSLASTHLASCPYETVRDFFPLNNSRLSSLTAENILLKHRVEALEGMVHTFKREMQAVKTALGPWYRLDGANRSTVLATSDTPSNTQSTSSRRFSMHDAAAISSLSSVRRQEFTAMVPDSSAVPDVLAPYFPPAAHASPLQQQLDQQHLRDIHARHRHSASVAHFADLGATYYQHPSIHHANFPRPISQNHSSVTPIDVGTTLEGSLKSIRESIVTLSTSLDSVTRQQDLALTNETLKLNEEVTSLKVIMHGLRMQVSLRR